MSSDRLESIQLISVASETSVGDVVDATADTHFVFSQVKRVEERLPNGNSE